MNKTTYQIKHKKTQQIIEKELIGKLFHALKQNLFVLLRSLLKYSEYKIMPTVTKNLIIINVLVFSGHLSPNDTVSI